MMDILPSSNPSSSDSQGVTKDFRGTRWIFFISTLPFCVFLILFVPYLTIVSSILTSLIIAWISSLWIKRLLAAFFPYRISTHDKAVLITGCDYGVGHGAALALNKRGFLVFATCLNANSEGASKLKSDATNPDRMIVFNLDISSEQDADNAVETVRHHLNEYKVLDANAQETSQTHQLWALVNNAAISRTGKLEWGEFDYHFQPLFQVNVVGTVRITRKFLPLLRESRGRIIFMSSVAGRVTDACYAAYSMTKHAITSFADGLRLEMARFGIRVVTIEPWFLRTPMMDQDVTLGRLNKMWQQTPFSIQAVYGQHDFDKLRRNIQLLINEPGMGLDESYRATLSNITRSVLSLDPEYAELACSTAQRPILYLIQVIPREWVDLYFQIVKVFLNIVERINKKRNIGQ
ncbi:D-beta-hydroxybutyrate dehydrogenase, mitochondrial-like [Brevipalpus obovatus]|uniref:D-beta-hydroxybutyrate dehydrogenase, mitochondrial-like n=1 Tax=Brevipalpus obovatus TaxID=246614 RepID=UPI003D9F5B2E